MKTIQEILTNKEIEEVEKSKNILGIPDFETIDYNLSKHWDQYGIGLYNEIRKNQLLTQINEKLEAIQIILEERT